MRCGGHKALLAGTCAAAFLLGACGGGGGGGVNPIPSPTPGPTPTPTPTPTPGSGLNDAEYQASNSAVLANALTAYEAGATGAGVKVAVIDTGINPNLPEFTSRLDPASQDVAATRGIVDNQGHGTMVSGVIAANRDGTYMQGVAYNATIVSLDVYDPAGCKNGNDCFLDDKIDEAIDLARTTGAKIINMSFGDEEGMTPDVWPAIQRAVDAGLIIVMAAGNSGRADPNGYALQNIQNNGASGLFIIAGAMDSDRNISSFSNRAGTSQAAQSFLVALGRGNATVNQFGQHVNVSGTSFATPTIVGAAALLASAFPNLTGPQIVSLLLSSADDAGATGTDAIYGRGILNIANAFKPKGQTTLAGSSQAVSLFDNGISSTAMGDATASSSAKAVVLDGYARAYVLDLAKTVRAASPDRPLSQTLGTPATRTSAFGAGPVSMQLTSPVRSPGMTGNLPRSDWMAQADRDQAKRVALLAVTRLSSDTKVAFGLSQDSQALRRQLIHAAEGNFLVARDSASAGGLRAMPSTAIGLRHAFGRVGMTVTQERGKSWTLLPGIGAELPDYRIDNLSFDAAAGPATLVLSASRQQESGTVLGARFASPVHSGGATTYFADGRVQFDLGRGWTSSASYRRGWTALGSGSGLARSGNLTSEAMAFDLSAARPFGLNGALSFRYSQPLRIVGGGLNLITPSGWDYHIGQASYSQSFLGLAPRGRERDFELVYATGAFGGSLDLHGFARLQPGNIRDARRDAGAAIRFTLLSR